METARAWRFPRPGSNPLPPGLNLNPAGNLSGTPTAAGAYSFTVRATDNGGNFVDKLFNVTINPALVINPNSPLPSGTTGAAYSQNLTATGGSVSTANRMKRYVDPQIR